MNLLFIGDIVGKGGRKTVNNLIPEIRRNYKCSYCIANGENMANGAGINEKCINEVLKPGIIDVITLGDHVWDQKSFEQEIKKFKNVLRPANLNPKQPGIGYNIFRPAAGGDIAVINLIGRIFMKGTASSPFDAIDNILKKLPSYINTIFVDFHAEATSEKIAMGRYIDGKVTSVLGTHTHVQTNDSEILPNNTAYMTDVGMVGAHESILGRNINSVVYQFTTDMPTKLEVIERGNMRLDCAIISYNKEQGKAEKIQPLSIKTKI